MSNAKNSQTAVSHRNVDGNAELDVGRVAHAVDVWMLYMCTYMMLMLYMMLYYVWLCVSRYQQQQSGAPLGFGGDGAGARRRPHVSEVGAVTRRDGGLLARGLV